MSFDQIAQTLEAEIQALRADIATVSESIKAFRSEFGTGTTARRLEDLPLVLTADKAAEVYQINRNTLYQNPKKYGGKKIRGKGAWKFPRDTVLRIAGYALPQGGKEE